MLAVSLLLQELLLLQVALARLQTTAAVVAQARRTQTEDYMVAEAHPTAAAHKA
jgi:hypothetical protein